MNLILAEDEIIDFLIEDYDVDEMDAHDAVIAAKVLDLIDPKASKEDNAEKIYGTAKCWS